MRFQLLSVAFLSTLAASSPIADSIKSGQHMARSYVPGTCGVHVTQYQKTDPSTDNYHFDVRIYDNSGTDIGAWGNLNAPTDKTIILDSALPYSFWITAGAIDIDPVAFQYAAQQWNSKSSQCSVGGYDSGERQMDCSFGC